MKHTIAGLALALTFLGGMGCGGSQKTNTAAGPTCADAGAHTHALMMAGPEADANVADVMSKTMVDSCKTDGWSAEAIGCMATAAQDEMAACPEKLTQAQRDSFQSAVMSVLGGGGAPPSEGEEGGQ